MTPGEHPTARTTRQVRLQLQNRVVGTAVSQQFAQGILVEVLRVAELSMQATHRLGIRVSPLGVIRAQLRNLTGSARRPETSVDLAQRNSECRVTKHIVAHTSHFSY